MSALVCDCTVVQTGPCQLGRQQQQIVCVGGWGGPRKGGCINHQNLLNLKNKHQVHIAYFLYLQVQKNAYVYLHFEILAASTHSPISVLASTKK